MVSLFVLTIAENICEYRLPIMAQVLGSPSNTLRKRSANKQVYLVQQAIFSLILSDPRPIIVYPGQSLND